MSDVDRDLRDYIDYARMSERLTRVEEWVRLQERDDDFRTKSGNYDVEAIVARGLVAARTPKTSTIPPGLKAIYDAAGTGLGRSVTLAAAVVIGWLVRHLWH